MPFRTRIFIVISILVFGILGVSLLLLSNRDNNSSTIANNDPFGSAGVIEKNNFDEAVLAGVEPTVIPQGLSVKPQTSAEAEKNGVSQLAKIFVERYNTYSSENSYQNIRDVKNFVTESYWSKISSPLSVSTKSDTFVAATTEVVSLMETEMDSGSATVTLKAKKINERSGNTSSSYVDYVVSLIKDGDNWFISSQTEKSA